MIDQYEEVFVHDKSIMYIAKVNSYDDLVNTFAKSYFKRGIVKTKNRNDRFVKEILTNQNFQNFMIHYFAEKICDEANRK